MNAELTFVNDQATRSELLQHLQLCDAAFVPRLSSRVDLGAYAEKLATRALRLEAWCGTTLVGVVAVYCNDPQRPAYITNVSLLDDWQSKGIAGTLLQKCMAELQMRGVDSVSLEVGKGNKAALRLYEKLGFQPQQETPQTWIMCRSTGKELP